MHAADRSITGPPFERCQIESESSKNSRLNFFLLSIKAISQNSTGLFLLADSSLGQRSFRLFTKKL